MDRSKRAIRNIAQICKGKGIDKIVISPGSRNAPIILAFKEAGIKIYKIVDERSAAFFALGIAQLTRKPVAIACTSGSAVLNYAPAIAEAYYQRVPLLVLTADRVNQWLDMEDSQTVRQSQVFQNYIKASIEIPQDIADDKITTIDRKINQAIRLCGQAPSGPIHINLPFREPLYSGFDEELGEIEISDDQETDVEIDSELLSEIKKKWHNSSKKMIICGMLKPSSKLNSTLEELAKDPSVVVLTETTSNLCNPLFNPSIDRSLSAIHADEIEDFTPEILITTGNQIISKRIKAFFKINSAKHHWHVSEDDLFVDEIEQLEHKVLIKPEKLFEHLLDPTNSESSFNVQWKSLDISTKEKHEDYLLNCPHSDLKVMESILKSLPSDSILQMGNSTVVRYIQLFGNRKDICYYGNRGTSGIDGSLSTAVGAALISEKATTVVLGDLSFFYDSNGLWNEYLSKNLKIIIINNGGGGIFRFIDGPTTTDALEYFETPHQRDASMIAKTFDVNYLSASSIKETEEKLKELYNGNACSILEIFTPQTSNAEILKAYFQYLGQ